MEYFLDIFYNNLDIDIDDKKFKGQNGVIVVLYEIFIKFYFLLSIIRDIKVSNKYYIVIVLKFVLYFKNILFR